MMDNVKKRDILKSIGRDKTRLDGNANLYFTQSIIGFVDIQWTTTYWASEPELNSSTKLFIDLLGAENKGFVPYQGALHRISSNQDC